MYTAYRSTNCFIRVYTRACLRTHATVWVDGMKNTSYTGYLASPQPQAKANSGVLPHLTWCSWCLVSKWTMTLAFSPSAGPEAIREAASAAGRETYRHRPHRNVNSDQESVEPLSRHHSKRGPPGFLGSFQNFNKDFKSAKKKLKKNLDKIDWFCWIIISQSLWNKRQTASTLIANLSHLHAIIPIQTWTSAAF